jgi:hypothetical protein
MAKTPSGAFAMPAEIGYPHRLNRDGTWDSICKKCFHTIANCKTERELADFEKAHVCNQSTPAEHGYYFITPRPVS